MCNETMLWIFYSSPLVRALLIERVYQKNIKNNLLWNFKNNESDN